MLKKTALAMTVLVAGCSQGTPGPAEAAGQGEAQAQVQALCDDPGGGGGHGGGNPFVEDRWTSDDDDLIATQWSGNDDLGTLYMPLWRGAAPGLEDWVYAPPDGDCTRVKGTVHVAWDSAHNTVHIVSKWKGLPQHPSIHRTDGVNWWFNPFHQAPKDFDNGTYRLWLVLADPTHPGAFYYDPTTTNLLGSFVDFPAGPPAGAITLNLPLIPFTATLSFNPDRNGNAIHSWDMAYDHISAEGGFYSQSIASFPPPDLCHANSAAIEKTNIRAYASAWQPVSTGLGWKDVLHRHPLFDLNVEESGAFTATHGQLPYVYSGVAFVGNAAGHQGGIPNGYTNKLMAGFRNVAPAIDPTPGGNGQHCVPFLNDPRNNVAPNYCTQAH